jgi:hypothetical protein
MILAPSQAAIHLELAESEADNNLLSGSVSWLASGLHIELSQYVAALQSV